MPEILQYDFMLRAFGAGIAIGIIAPVIGMFLVVRGYSYMADTLAHVSLVGVAVAVLSGINPILSAMVIAVIAAAGIEKLRSTGRVFGESILALFLSGSLAIAVVLLSIAGGFTVDLFSFLFGSITTVAPFDLYVIGALTIGGLFLTILFYKMLFVIAFDEQIARADGIRARALSLFLVVMAAVTVSLAMRIVGILLVGALMVIPAVTAMQFGKGFRHTMGLAVLLSLCAVVGGLVASFYLDVASGGTIVVISLLLFLLVLLFSNKK